MSTLTRAGGVGGCAAAAVGGDQSSVSGTAVCGRPTSASADRSTSTDLISPDLTSACAVVADPPSAAAAGGSAAVFRPIRRPYGGGGTVSSQDDDFSCCFDTDDDDDDDLRYHGQHELCRRSISVPY